MLEAQDLTGMEFSITEHVLLNLGWQGAQAPVAFSTGQTGA